VSGLLGIAFLYSSIGACLVAIFHWQLWLHLPVIVSRDTLWHLSPVVRVMLVALCTCAVVATALCCLVKSVIVKRRFYKAATFDTIRWVGLFVVDLTATFALLWGAISIAPQLFYMLYVTVFPELSSQWVAKPVDLGTLLKFLKLSPAESMATLIAGFMMWTILTGSIVLWLCFPARLITSKQ